MFHDQLEFEMRKEALCSAMIHHQGHGDSDEAVLQTAHKFHLHSPE